MILAHSIIPHNHAENDFSSCNGHLHSSGHHSNVYSLAEEVHGQDEDEAVCRILNLLFHHFNQDNLIIHITREVYFSSLPEKGSAIFSGETDFYKKYFVGSAHLRAPPRA